MNNFQFYKYKLTNKYLNELDTNFSHFFYNLVLINVQKIMVIYYALNVTHEK